MTATARLSRVNPYLRRLVEDEYIQDQIREAITELRKGSRRAKGRSAGEALTDEKLRSQLIAAITLLTNARRALKEPRRRRRPLRRIVVLALPLAAAVAWQRRSAAKTS